MSLEKYLDALKKESTFSDIVYERQQIDEAGTAHPLPGHDYHKKTDAELHFIARDAKEAEDAMSGHNPKAANKYADQKNDAATILHFRKKGMPDWYKKKYGHIKEETEINEAAKDLPTWKLRSLVKNEIGGKENAEELAKRQKEKKAGTYKSHSSDDAQAGVKDAKNFREETEINEISLGAKIRAHALRKMYGFEGDDVKEYDKADKIRDNIAKKHGPEAVKHADAAADSAIWGRDHKRGEDSLSGGLRDGLSKDTKKDGTIKKSTQVGMKHAAKRGRVSGPVGHLPEETEIVEDNSALDAMDAKEKRKDKIRKFIKKQTPVKVKHTPGKQTVQKEEIELEESEKNKRIHQALADTERYIEKESKRDPKLRPKDVQDRLDYYIKHRDKLKSMLENVDQIDEALPPHLAKHVDEKGNLKDPKKQKSFEEMMKKKIKDAVVKDVTPTGYGPKNEESESIDELSNELLDRYKKAAGESAREADKKGDFKKGNKRFSGIVKATKKQFDNDEKHSVKEDVDINEESEEAITHHAHMHKGKSYYPQRKDGHKYVGMAGYKKGGKGGTYKSGMIVQHKDNGKYAVGNVSSKTVWHDKVEDAVAHAHKRFKMDHKNVSADKVHVDYD